MGAALVAANYGGAGVMQSAVLLGMLTYCLCVSASLKEMRKFGVYLTVSSYTDLFNYGQFEVNWFGMTEQYIGKAYVGLLKNDLPKRELLAKWLVTQADGKRTTGIDAPLFPLDTLMKGGCLGYSAALLLKTKTEGHYLIVISSCFSSRPHWMRKICCALSRLTLQQILIPGTHNSGMYNLGYAHPHEKLYLYNQDQTIRHQLAFGTRALDLRVQYYYGEFYVTHGSVRGWITVKEVLSDVLWFVKETRELVLLDFHRFTTGFEKPHEYERHLQLQALIVKELDDVLLDNIAWRRPIRDILGDCTNENSKKGRVIVFYNGISTPKFHHYLSNAVDQMWPNAQDTGALKSYLENRVCVKHSEMAGIMAEMTASFPKLIVGNRVAAEWVNFMVTEFFRTNFDRCRGIIYTDFFLGNGMIDVAVEANIVIAHHHQASNGVHCNIDSIKSKIFG